MSGACSEFTEPTLTEDLPLPRETTATAGYRLSHAERLGRYTLLHKLASGGMADIWLARHESFALNRIVVVKRIRNELARRESFVRMFIEEARTSARINHPNAVQILECDCQDGEFFIAME